MAFHVNTNTGKSGLCRAATPEACPFGEGSGNNHYATEAEAKKAGEKVLKTKHGAFSATRKNRSAHDSVNSAEKLHGSLEYAPNGSRVRLSTGEEVTVERSAIGRIKLIDDKGYNKAFAFKSLERLEYDLIGGVTGKEAEDHLKLGVLGRERKVWDRKITEVHERIATMLGSLPTVNARVIVQGMIPSAKEPYIHIYGVNRDSENFRLKVKQDESGKTIVESDGDTTTAKAKKAIKKAEKLTNLSEFYEIAGKFLEASKEYWDFRDGIDKASRNN